MLWRFCWPECHLHFVWFSSQFPGSSVCWQWPSMSGAWCSGEALIRIIRYWAYCCQAQGPLSTSVNSITLNFINLREDPEIHHYTIYSIYIWLAHHHTTQSHTFYLNLLIKGQGKVRWLSRWRSNSQKFSDKILTLVSSDLVMILL